MAPSKQTRLFIRIFRRKRCAGALKGATDPCQAAPTLVSYAYGQARSALITSEIQATVTRYARRGVRTFFGWRPRRRGSCEDLG
jgi:hypothetical protein